MRRVGQVFRHLLPCSFPRSSHCSFPELSLDQEKWPLTGHFRQERPIKRRSYDVMNRVTPSVGGEESLFCIDKSTPEH